MRASVLALILFGWQLAQPSASLAAEPSMRVLVRAAKPYDRVVSEIQARGGQVTRRYRQFDGIAAEVPLSAIDGLRAVVGSSGISKDEFVWLAFTNHSTRLLEGKAALAKPSPRARRFVPNTGRTHRMPTDNLRVNVKPLHDAGYKGQGVIVAVIDTGLRPGYPHLDG